MEEGWIQATKRTGRWAYYDQDEKLLKTGRFKAGEMDGPWRYWHRDKPSQLKVIEHYRFGVLHGRSSGWREDGKLLFRSDFIDGRRHGVSESFSSDGTLRSSVHFVRGIKHGPVVEIDRYGIRWRGRYDGSEKDGTWIAEDAATRIRTLKQDWRRGKENGERTEYWANGKRGCSSTTSSACGTAATRGGTNRA